MLRMSIVPPPINPLVLPVKLPPPNKASGFTLLELLLYVTMTGILLTSVSLTYYVTLRSRIKSETVSDIDIVGRMAMERINQTIRNANAITSPAAGSSQASLTLSVSDGAKNPTVFSLSGGTLMMQEGSNAAVALTPTRITVSSLSFANYGRTGTEGIIRTQFTVARSATSTRSEYQYSKSFTASAGIR